MGLKEFVTRHFGGYPTNLSSLRWFVRINPDSSNSFPTAQEYRVVAPGSRPQPPAHVFEAPLAKFRYYERDGRRNRPQTVTFTPAQLAALPPLIGDGARAMAVNPSTPVADMMTLNFKRTYTKGISRMDPTGSPENPDFSITTVQ